MRKIHKLSITAMADTQMIAPIVFRRVQETTFAKADDVIALLAAGGATYLGEVEIDVDDAKDGIGQMRAAIAEGEEPGSTLYVDEISGRIFIARDMNMGRPVMLGCANILDLCGDEADETFDYTRFVVETGTMEIVGILRTMLGYDLTIARELYKKRRFGLQRTELVRVLVGAVGRAAATNKMIDERRLCDRNTRTGVAVIVTRAYAASIQDAA